MNAIDLDDTAQKIAEIREALVKIDRGDLSEIEDAHGKAGEWLRFLLDELDRLKREIESHGPEGRNYTNQQVVELRLERERLIEENRKLWEERNKLIEGLRWYADEDTHEIKRRVLGDFAPITLDKGQRAREILKEIGVTVE